MNDYNRYRFSTAKDVINHVLKTEYEVNFRGNVELNEPRINLSGHTLLSDEVVSVFEFDNFLHYVPLEFL